MIASLYLGWRYLLFHRYKTAVLVGSVTLIVYLPIGLHVLVEQGARRLRARALATPLIVGARDSPLELVLNTIYFRSEIPEPLAFGEVGRLGEDNLAEVIPIYARFRCRSQPIVGTTLEYFRYRGLQVAAGRQLAMLGDCVLGARAAEALGVEAGGHVMSSPESVFDLAGSYPLRMSVVGVLAFSDTPDDEAVFVDVKTAWIIEGLGHGHRDLQSPDAAASVLKRDGSRITANASVVQYAEVTAENGDAFHFHGDTADFPLTACILLPRDDKSSALIQGRFESAEVATQIVRPAEVMEGLLGTVMTVQAFIIAGSLLVGTATMATAGLVFLLSLRLRRREIETLYKIGSSRGTIVSLMASEIGAVVVASVLLAGGLTLLTRELGSAAIRALLLP